MDNIKYIYNYIDSNFYMISELQNKRLMLSIAKEISNDMNMVDFRTGKYDFYINEIVKTKLHNAKDLNNYFNVRNYIHIIILNYKLENNIELIENDELQNRITTILFKYKYNDIMNGKYDDLIISLTKEYTSRLDKNSKLNDALNYVNKSLDDKPMLSDCELKSIKKYNDEKTKLRNRKVKLNNRIKAVALATAITTMSITASIGFSKYQDTLVSDISVIDDYDYPTIPYEMSNEFSATLEHVREIYDAYNEYGSEYGQICLYKAYDSFKYDKFECTDSIISILQADDNPDEGYIYDDVKNSTCYPVYVYNKLKEADIDVSGYTDAVHEYDRQFANYRLVNPTTKLTNHQNNTLERMMNRYERYINKLTDELEGEKIK